MSEGTRRCSRCETAIETGDLRCPVCGIATAGSGNAATPASLSVQQLRCNQCGAAIAYDASIRAPACAFCGARLQVETAHDPVEQAEGAVPFSVSEANAKEALRGFFHRKRFFDPVDLASEATVDSLKAIWWPAWIFDAEAEVSWTADSDAGAGRSDWAPHAGLCRLNFKQQLVSASRGLSQKECQLLAPYFDLSDIVPPPLAQGPIVIERFDTQRSAARKRVIDGLQSAAAQIVREQHVPGNRTRNVRVSLLLRGLTTRRLSLPSYVLAYRYRGTLYRTVIHGQNADIVFGDRPRSVWKMLGLGFLALMLLLFFLAGFCSQAGQGEW